MDIIKPASRRRQWLPLLAGATLLVLLGTSLFGLTRFEEALPELNRASVWSGAVERGELRLAIRATGRFVPARERWITAASDGLVETIAVEDGDAVEGGALLLELSNADAEQRALEARLTARTERASARASEARLHNAKHAHCFPERGCGLVCRHFPEERR